MDDKKEYKAQRERIETMRKILDIAVNWSERNIASFEAITLVKHTLDDRIEKIKAPNTFLVVSNVLIEASTAYEDGDQLRAIRILKKSEEMLKKLREAIGHEIETPRKYYLYDEDGEEE